MASEAVDILGVPVLSLSMSDLHDYIEGVIDAGAKSLVLNVNAHALNLACEQPWLLEFFRQADIVFADGYGAVWAGRVLGHSMMPRITYADWFWQLAGFAAARGFSLYFLGGRPGVAEQARRQLEKRYPRLRVVGTHHGYFDHAANSAENQQVLTEINGKRPGILVVAFGMPLQERWLRENWGSIEAKVALTGGAVFDYISGRLRRPPRLLVDHGLEWLGRLVIEPRRLWRRYLLGNPKFVWRVIRARLGGRNHHG